MFGSKLGGIRSSHRLSNQISDSVRGADSTELTSVRVNNEVAFCKVYNLKQKEETAISYLLTGLESAGQSESGKEECL